MFERCRQSYAFFVSVASFSASQMAKSGSKRVFLYVYVLKLNLVPRFFCNFADIPKYTLYTT